MDGRDYGRKGIKTLGGGPCVLSTWTLQWPKNWWQDMRWREACGLCAEVLCKGGKWPAGQRRAVRSQWAWATKAMGKGRESSRKACTMPVGNGVAIGVKQTWVQVPVVPLGSRRLWPSSTALGSLVSSSPKWGWCHTLSSRENQDRMCGRGSTVLIRDKHLIKGSFPLPGMPLFFSFI